MIVHDLEPITLVGGGITHKADFEDCLAFSSCVVAADGGAGACLDYGITPVAVIGDMDSVCGDVLRRLAPETIHRIDEQNSTDFDKALRSVKTPLVLGIGFTGARVDHELACYNALLRHADRRCVLLGESDIIFLAPPSLTLRLAPETRVSLFPLTKISGHSDGLLWPISGVEFGPDGQIGTSNMATGDVTLRMDRAGMLVILPRACLEIAVRALLAQSGSWPAL